METGQHDRTDRPDDLTVEDLEREKLVAYLDWADSGPGWFVPVYALSVGLWVASYDLGTGWAAGAALVFSGVMGWLIHAVTEASGVSLPRFRSMPPRLRRTFLPIPLIGLSAVGAIGLAHLLTDDVSHLLLGLLIGPAVGGAVSWNTRWFRRVAHRLAAEAGVPR